MPAKSILNMNWTRGTRELESATRLTELEAMKVRIDLAYSLQLPCRTETERLIGNNVEADVLHSLVEFVNRDTQHQNVAAEAGDRAALAYGDADLEELQARHNDWLDNQRTQEEARY